MKISDSPKIVFLKQRGFTLVEMLAVIAVIASLMTVGIVAIKGAGSTQGPSAGIATVDTLISEARDTARSKGVNARLLFHAEFTPLAETNTSTGAAEAKRYLRYISIAYQDASDSGTWIVDQTGVLLPENTYFNVDLSSRDGATVELTSPPIKLPGRNTEPVECYYYEFDSQGRVTAPVVPDAASNTVRLVLTGGAIRETDGDIRPVPKPTKAGERNNAGLVIWATGRTSLIRDYDEIDGGTAANAN